MANFYGVQRTNYYRVTDEDKYAELIKHIKGTDSSVEHWTIEKDGETYHAMGCYGEITYCNPDIEEDESEYDLEDDINDFFYELQKILPEDEAFILVGTGNEKLRYLDTWSTVVTAKEIKHFDAQSIGVEYAEKVTNNDQITYPSY